MTKNMDKKQISLNKFLSSHGVGSRRATALWIEQGRVTVNNTVITEPGFKLDTAKDEVCFDGNKVTAVTLEYILLNKPQDYITTVQDEHNRKTVMDLIKHATRQRIYPVGRLDRQTTGLILLTNDGDLAQKLAHPRYQIHKTYHVTLNQPLSAKNKQRIHQGILLNDGIITVDKLAYASPASRNELIVQLHSGRNRIIRRLFAACGYTVTKLDRIEYASLTKKGLALGSWRQLTQSEINTLKKI